MEKKNNGNLTADLSKHNITRIILVVYNITVTACTLSDQCRRRGFRFPSHGCPLQKRFHFTCMHMHWCPTDGGRGNSKIWFFFSRRNGFRFFTLTPLMTTTTTTDIVILLFFMCKIQHNWREFRAFFDPISIFGLPGNEIPVFDFVINDCLCCAPIVIILLR